MKTLRNCKACGDPTPSGRAKWCDACRPRSKYGSSRVNVSGKKFSSRKEAERFVELARMAEAGTITCLRLQPRYPILIDGELICVYVADFSYVDCFSKTIVEDVKSRFTAKNPVYRIKKKLMKAVNKIGIVEVGL